MKISIAGINICVQGEIYDYFKYRARKYVIPEESYCPVTITYNENKDILVPKCEIVKQDGFRVFAKGENSIMQYDILKEDKCSAIILANEDWTNIKCELCDVEDLGGASLNVRQFNMIGMVVKYIVMHYSGMCLHSSSISYKNSGIMFSANSGTGKSTHTRLWQKVFDDVCIVNDDMPAIRYIDNAWYLYGCPWSGKTETNSNVKVPLKALVFIERGTVNAIERIYAPECVFKIINQTLLPAYKDLAEKVMANISKLVEDIPIYLLKCTISEEAPKVVAKELGLL